MEMELVMAVTWRSDLKNEGEENRCPGHLLVWNQYGWSPGSCAREDMPPVKTGSTQFERALTQRFRAGLELLWGIDPTHPKREDVGAPRAGWNCCAGVLRCWNCYIDASVLGWSCCKGIDPTSQPKGCMGHPA